ncbi:MAG: CYTH domain-containing protein [Deltaproteobacteria bacterium]|nr:CYTH domain-containing protein [Deltaproteobacteria bacterium]
MATEIERKFLPQSYAWRSEARAAVRIAQGYLCSEPSRTVRVRLKGDAAFLTIKGSSVDGVSRAEFEYPIPVSDGRALLALCPSVLDKTRHLVDHGGFTWEVDEFHGMHQGLVIAELELPAVDTAFPKPAWVGREVTGDARYYNSALAQGPLEP